MFGNIFQIEQYLNHVRFTAISLVKRPHQNKKSKLIENRLVVVWGWEGAGEMGKGGEDIQSSS